MAALVASPPFYQKFTGTRGRQDTSLSHLSTLYSRIIALVFELVSPV
jgi:hypothetical protein